MLSADWRERIVSDPDTLLGKPRIKGTRIGVERVLELLASGGRCLKSYPYLQPADLQAVFALVRDCLKDGTYIMRPTMDQPGIAA